MIFKFSDTDTEAQGNSLVRKRIITQTHTEQISLTWAFMYGAHEKVVNDLSDRAYFIIAGEGNFEVGDEKGPVNGGDVVLIPKGVPYAFDGHITYVVINAPGFVPGSDHAVR